jgi:hypothetical protein
MSQPLCAQSGWQEEVRLTNDDAISFVPPNNGKFLAVDRMGRLHVVWADDRDKNYEIYYKYRSNGTWSIDERLTFDSARSARPVLAVDEFNRLHLVWNDSRDGNKEIYHKIKNVSWSEDRRVTETDGNSFAPSIVADGLTIHLVYNENISDHLEIMYRLFDVFEWSEAIPLTNVQSGDRMVPSIAIGPDGSIHVTWWDTREDSTGNTNGKIYYKRRTQDWLAEELVSDPSADAMRPNITVDDSGYVHVAWIDTRETYEQIYYRRRAPQGWEPEIDLTRDEATHYHPSIAAAGGEVFLVYWDDHLSFTNSEIFFRRRVNGNWVGPIRISRGEAGSTLPCLIAESNKNLHTAWVDERHGYGNMEIYYRAYIDPQTGIGDEDDDISTDEETIQLLFDARPNPFSLSTSIKLSIATESYVRITIYDVSGRCVKILVEQILTPGTHTFPWNGRDNNGHRVSPGVYIALARIGKRQVSSKVLHIR